MIKFQKSIARPTTRTPFVIACPTSDLIAVQTYKTSVHVFRENQVVAILQFISVPIEAVWVTRSRDCPYLIVATRDCHVWGVTVNKPQPKNSGTDVMDFLVDRPFLQVDDTKACKPYTITISDMHSIRNCEGHHLRIRGLSSLQRVANGVFCATSFFGETSVFITNNDQLSWEMVTTVSSSPAVVRTTSIFGITVADSGGQEFGGTYYRSMTCRSAARFFGLTAAEIGGTIVLQGNNNGRVEWFRVNPKISDPGTKSVTRSHRLQGSLSEPIIDLKLVSPSLASSPVIVAFGRSGAVLILGPSPNGPSSDLFLQKLQIPGPVESVSLVKGDTICYKSSGTLVMTRLRDQVPWTISTQANLITFTSRSKNLQTGCGRVMAYDIVAGSKTKPSLLVLATSKGRLRGVELSDKDISGLFDSELAADTSGIEISTSDLGPAALLTQIRKVSGQITEQQHANETRNEIIQELGITMNVLRDLRNEEFARMFGLRLNLSAFHARNVATIQVNLKRLPPGLRGCCIWSLIFTTSQMPQGHAIGGDIAGALHHEIMLPLANQDISNSQTKPWTSEFSLPFLSDSCNFVDVSIFAVLKFNPLNQSRGVEWKRIKSATKLVSVCTIDVGVQRFDGVDFELAKKLDSYYHGVASLLSSAVGVIDSNDATEKPCSTTDPLEHHDSTSNMIAPIFLCPRYAAVRVFDHVLSASKKHKRPGQCASIDGAKDNAMMSLAVSPAVNLLYNDLKISPNFGTLIVKVNSCNGSYAITSALAHRLAQCILPCDDTSIAAFAKKSKCSQNHSYNVRKLLQKVKDQSATGTEVSKMVDRFLRQAAVLKSQTSAQNAEVVFGSQFSLTLETFLSASLSVEQLYVDVVEIVSSLSAV